MMYFEVVLSDENRPIEFFKYFFLDNGIKSFRTRFFKEEKELFDRNFYVRYPDENNKSLEGDYMLYTTDRERKAENVQKIYFSTELENQMEHEVNQSKRFIEEKIAKFDFYPKRIETYLRMVMIDLIDVISMIKSDDEFTKYEIIIKILYQLIVDLHKKYYAFLSLPEFPIINEAKEFLKSGIMEPALISHEQIASLRSNELLRGKIIKQIRGFKWIVNPIENTFFLYDFLTKEKIIPEADTGDSFKIAFSGDIIVSPLKIKWLFRTKHRDIKPVIIRVINTLMDDLRLLEKITSPISLSRTIESVFADKDGNLIKNTNVTLAQMKTNKNIIKDPQQEELLQKLSLVKFRQ